MNAGTINALVMARVLVSPNIVFFLLAPDSLQAA
jgi:hypothetical protein